MREYHVRFRERFGVKFPLSTRPKWECRYHIVCTKISPPGNLQRHKSGCRTNTWSIMQKKRNRNNRSRMLSGSHPYDGKDITEIFGIRNCRVLKRKKVR